MLHLSDPLAACLPAVAPVRAPATALPVSVLGVAFDAVTQEQAVERIAAMVASRRPHYAVTANVDFLVQAQRDVELHRILLDADLVLCDGTPLLWASRWLGNPLPQRVAGADVVPLILRAAAANGHRVFLLGAGAGVAAAAAARLQREVPGLVIAGQHSPPFADLLAMDSAAIAHVVQAARPDLLLVSFGCPKQEKWIAMHYRQLGVPVVIGVGATLDFIAGRVRRAPLWMQRSGVEWLFRLLQEPRRLARRYLGDLVSFAPALVRQVRSLRADIEGPAPRGQLTATRTDDGRRIRLDGALTRATLERHPDIFAVAPPVGRRCELDLSQVSQMDSTGIAALLHWRRRLQAQHSQLILRGPSAIVRRAIAAQRLTPHFSIVRAEDRADALAPSMGVGIEVVPPFRGGHTVAWQGEVTAANAERVWDATVRHLAAVGPPPARTFIINLSGLRYIDSAGVALMARTRVWARSLQNELRFLAPARSVRHALRLAKRSDLLDASSL